MVAMNQIGETPFPLRLETLMNQYILRCLGRRERSRRACCSESFRRRKDQHRGITVFPQFPSSLQQYRKQQTNLIHPSFSQPFTTLPSTPTFRIRTMNVQQKDTNIFNSSRPKKTVMFADKEEVHEVIRRVSQMSRESVKGIWCDEEDFEAFLKDTYKCVKKMERGERLKDKRYSALGLENRTEEGQALRDAQKEYAWSMVLWEQTQQKEEGTRSSLQIRDAYREASRDAEVRAVELARELSDEVKGYLSKDMDLSNTSLDYDVDAPESPVGRTKPIRVRFAEAPEVHEVFRRVSQMSRRSKAGIWFGQEDFNMFIDEMDAAIEKLNLGECVGQNDTSLGLEPQTEEGRYLRDANKEETWDLVLGEQELQREQGITSPFQLARKSRKVSDRAAFKALALAQKVSEQVAADKDECDFELLHFPQSTTCA